MKTLSRSISFEKAWLSTRSLGAGNYPSIRASGPAPRRIRCCLFALVLCFSASNAFGDLLDDAIQAEQSGIPEVGITKAQQFLATQPDAARAEAARIFLARCFIRTNKPQQAEHVLDGMQQPEATFLRAEAARRCARRESASPGSERRCGGRR